MVKNTRLHPHLINGITEALMDIFQKGEYADKVVNRSLKLHSKWGARDRRFFAEGVYECVRWWRRLWFAADFDPEKYLDPAFITPAITEKIWYTWYVIHGNLNPQITDKINFKKNPVELWNNVPNRKIRESIPDWLDKMGETHLQQKWDVILTSLNKPARVYLRVNQNKTTRDSLVKELLNEGISANPVDDFADALFLSERKNVFVTQSYKKGFFEVQDIGSQKIAPFLDPHPGMRVIDACAGGGGKAIHMASLMKNKGKIIALDLNDWRLKPIRQRATKAGADIIEARVITSAKIIKRLYDSADRLLLDVPCSGTGVLRRNPDTKWKLSSEEFNNLLQVQQDILQNYSSMTKKGAEMVYCTCSVFPAENEEQIRRFLESGAGKNWQLIQEMNIYPMVESEFIQPAIHNEKSLQYFSNSDGFYAARLKRL